jgi:hypothetical protein
MANLFRDNAYNVLGLDISATQKEINKRSKEIVNLLRIDEDSEYETDISVAKSKRTEDTVKEAVQRLSSPTKKIQEYFFWFDIESDKDEKALKLLQAGNIDEAIQVWEQDSSKETATGFVAKKNLAILASVLLVEKGQKKHLTQSISCWKDLITSDKFWAYFEKIYALNDEVGTSDSAIRGFKSKVTDVLSDFYTDVSQNKADNSFYSLFAQVFGVKGQKMQRDVLSPIYEAINDTSEKLRNLNISEDNIISPEEIKELKRLTKLLQTNFDKLKELGLYSDSQSKTMRDKAAEALRTVALDLYNNLGESEKPVALFNIASKIAGTTGTINKINKDIETLRANRSDEKIIKPINELLEDEKFSEALDLIEKRLESSKSNKDLNEFLIARLKWAITGVAAKDYKETMAQFNKGQFAKAAQNFSGLKAFILSYITHFNFNEEAINNVLAEIDQLTGDAKALNLDNVQNYRNKLLEGTEETFKDSFEESLIVFLVDCGIYGNIATHLPAIKRKNTIKKWLWYIGIGIVLLIIFGSSGSDDTSTGNSPSSGSSGSSSSSAYNICSGEYDDIKADLDSIESQMDNYERSGNSDSFNALVPRQNSLVSQLNSKATECNGLR